MLSLQAHSSSLNAGPAKGGCLERKRLLGALQQSVPQNGRVHLHILDKKRADPENSGKFILGIPNGRLGMIFLGGWEWPKLICWARRNHKSFGGQGKSSSAMSNLASLTVKDLSDLYLCASMLQMLSFRKTHFHVLSLTVAVLAFLDFLAFFCFSRRIPCFLDAVFPFFPKEFGGSARMHTIGPIRMTQLIPWEFSGVTEVKLLRQLILWDYFGVIGGVLLPKRDNTRRCNLSWELRLLDPLKIFGVIGGVIVTLNYSRKIRWWGVIQEVPMVLQTKI